MTDLMTTCEQLIDLVGKRGEAVARASSGRQSLTRFANSFIHQNVSEDYFRVALDVIAPGGRAASASATKSDRESLAALVDRALAAAALRPEDPHWPGLAPPAPVEPVEHYDEATAAATPAERALAVRAFVDAGEGLEGAGACSTTDTATAFASSSGQRISGRSTSADLSGIHRTGSSDGSADQTSCRLADIDGAVAGARAAFKARAAEAATDLDPGEYEVVFDAPCLRDILQFLVMAGFNAKAHQEGTSFAHLGEAQFDAKVSIWDDATDPRTLGLPFDAEGTPQQRLDLVADGVTSNLLYDRRTAAKAEGVQSTGHASGSAAFGPMAGNVFFGEGSGTVDDLVASVDRGLLVSDFWYTRILDPKTQVVTGLTRNGVFLIEGGTVSKPVKNFRFTQSYAAALGPGRVKAIAGDARLCGRSHVPSIQLVGWNFTGGAKG